MFASRFTGYAWFVVLYNIGVILWGAVVRATGSGAGCGNHWPTCNGEIIPLNPEIETLIEFSHRITSAFAGILVIILVVWAFRRVGSSRLTKVMAVLSLIFIIIEGALGAGLVVLELVADNDSALRAFMIALHLANTLVLLTWLALTAWASDKPHLTHFSMPTRHKILIGSILFILAITSSMGAVTALGDTLFPAENLIDGMVARYDPTSHFLVQLRLVHPSLAILASLGMIFSAVMLRNRIDTPRMEKRANMLIWLTMLQLIVGGVNVVLLAPVAISLIHLLIADAMWILMVILVAEAYITEKQKNEADVPIPSQAVPA